MRSILTILNLVSLRIFAEPCSKNPTGKSYGIDWGTFSSVDDYDPITCLTITNDRPHHRDEVAFSGIPISQKLSLRDTDLNKLVLVGMSNKRIPCQFEVISRWGGSLDQTSRIIRWLQVASPISIDANDDATFELRMYHKSQEHLDDPKTDVLISKNGDSYVVSTGVATFDLDPKLGAVINQIQLEDNTILTYQSSTSGPSITFIPQKKRKFGSSPRTLTSHTHATIDYFEVTESGPVKVVVMVEGTWSDPSGASLCNTFSTNDPTPYESFTFSLSFTFFRGRSDFKVQFHVGNECSNADGSSWIDQLVIINQASFALDFRHGISPSASSTHLYGSYPDGSISDGFPSGPFVTTKVEQRRGSGSPWKRRARVTNNGSIIQTREKFVAPIIAVASSKYMASATLGFMQYREPQALTVTGSLISIDVVSEQQRVGEGKGLWNHGMILIREINGSIQSTLQSARWPAVLECERGLLFHAPPQYSQSTGVFPPLGHGNTPSTTIKSSYLNMMETLHSATTRPDGQWERAKTYGSQIWPDVQFDGWAIDFPDNPNENSPKTGYWNPHAHELAEFFRSGNPKWVHDFSLPLSWLMTFTAYLNVGRQTHDWSRNGLCVNSGDSGDGNWHRSGFGSDDYMYNLAMKNAYPLRPDPIHRRRIEITGRTVRLRYDRSVPEDDRDIYLEKLDVARGVIQHMEAGMNCAEFGMSGGNECHNWFLDVMKEFITDNLSTGAICQPDKVVGRQCGQPQTFMQFSMLYEFFLRVHSNYGDLNDGLHKAIVGIPSNFYDYGLQKSGSNIVYAGNHAALLGCTTNRNRNKLSSCVFEDVGGGDGRYLYDHNINSVLSALIIADFFDPSIGFCRLVESAWSSSNAITNTWQTVNYNDGGWTKPTSQMMSLMAYGVGAFDMCHSPPPPSPPSPSPTKSPTPFPTQAPMTSPTSAPASSPVILPTLAPVLSPVVSPTPAPLPSTISPTRKASSYYLHCSLNSKASVISPNYGFKGETSLSNSEFTAGLVGKSASFGEDDGSGKYIRFRAGLGRKNKRHISFKSGSVSFYYKPSYASSADDVDHILFVVGDYYGSPKMVLMEGDTLKFRIQQGYTKTWETSTTWRADLWKKDEWVFIQVTWNKKLKQSSMKIFVNGTRVDINNLKGGWKLGNEKKGGYIYVGSSNTNGDFPANGAIDEIKISKSTKKIKKFMTPQGINES